MDENLLKEVRENMYKQYNKPEYDLGLICRYTNDNWQGHFSAGQNRAYVVITILEKFKNILTFDEVKGIIEKVKSAYPGSIFPKPKEGSSIDCYSAEACRITCDNILRELEDYIKENK